MPLSILFPIPAPIEFPADLLSSNPNVKASELPKDLESNPFAIFCG